jgi:hypothetical protein
MKGSIKSIGIFRENLRISLRAIRSNRVRAILTICIIAIGIMALVGIIFTDKPVYNDGSQFFHHNLPGDEYSDWEQ